MRRAELKVIISIGICLTFGGCRESSSSSSPAELTALAIVAHNFGSVGKDVLICSSFESGLSPEESVAESKEILLQGLNTEMGLQESTVDSFLKANLEKADLDYDFPKNFRATVISREALEELVDTDGHREAGWNNLFSQFDGVNGVYWISRIGHNEVKDQALIWVRFQSGAKYVSGNFYMLTKLGESWAVTRLPIPTLIGKSESNKAPHRTAAPPVVQAALSIKPSTQSRSLAPGKRTGGF